MLRQLFAVCAAASVTLVACGGSVPGDLFADSDASADGSTSKTEAGASVLPDGAVVSGPDAGTAPDGSPGTATLTCGTSVCKLPGETCCVRGGSGSSFTYACVTGTTCPNSGGGNGTAALACTGAASCSSGTVCCVSQNNNQTVSACKPTCGGNDAQLCDPSAIPTGCSAQAPCSNKQIGGWQLPPSFGTCGGKGN